MDRFAAHTAAWHQRQHITTIVGIALLRINSGIAAGGGDHHRITAIEHDPLIAGAAVGIDPIATSIDI